MERLQPSTEGTPSFSVMQGETLNGVQRCAGNVQQMQHEVGGEHAYRRSFCGCWTSVWQLYEMFPAMEPANAAAVGACLQQRTGTLQTGVMPPAGSAAQLVCRPMWKLHNHRLFQVLPSSTTLSSTASKTAGVSSFKDPEDCRLYVCIWLCVRARVCVSGGGGGGGTAIEKVGCAGNMGGECHYRQDCGW
jgi:hypothetical protein